MQSVTFGEIVSIWPFCVTLTVNNHRSGRGDTTGRHDSDSDASPPRRQPADGRHDSDASPPRRQSAGGRHDSDASPPRRQAVDSGRDSDPSPPRRRATGNSNENDSDASPPRKRPQQKQRSGDGKRQVKSEHKLESRATSTTTGNRSSEGRSDHSNTDRLGSSKMRMASG